MTKSTRLVTTVREESHAGKQTFVIRGEPTVQGMAWLIWGPVAALLVVMLLTGLAMAFEINQQIWETRLLFVALFLLLPALAWGLVAPAVSHFSKKHLQTVRAAEAQECVIQLDQSARQLSYRIVASSIEKKLAYEEIRQASLTYPIGKRDGKNTRLTLSTDEGEIILLDDALGTQLQKRDLAQKIQQALGRS